MRVSPITQLEELSSLQAQWDNEDLLLKEKRHPKDFPALPELPAARYTSHEFYELENQFLWSRTWLLVGFGNEIKTPGSFKTISVQGKPIILVRDNDGEINAFYNVCQHRGGVLCREAQGKLTRFRCPYHSWAYDLKGQLTFVPSEHEFPNLDKSQKSLGSVRCESYGNLIFISLSNDVEPLQQFLGEMVELTTDVPFDKVQHYRTDEWVINANWKTTHDAFQETYHARYVHPKTAHQALDTLCTVRYMLHRGHSLQYPKSRRDESKATIYSPISAENRVLKESTLYAQRTYHLFPNMTLPVSEGNFSFIMIWPISVSQTLVQLHFVKISDDDSGIETPADKDAADAFSAVIDEDVSTLDGMATSLATGGTSSIPLCYGERALYHHHLAVDKCIGREKIPEALRVPPIEIPIVEA